MFRGKIALGFWATRKRKLAYLTKFSLRTVILT